MVTYRGLTLMLVAVAIYLLWMDFLFYLEIKQLVPRLVQNSSSSSYVATQPKYTYSPFHPITVQLMMFGSTLQVTN